MEDILKVKTYEEKMKRDTSGVNVRLHEARYFFSALEMSTEIELHGVDCVACLACVAYVSVAKVNPMGDLLFLME